MNARTATFAGGCFWCIEAPFLEMPGVFSVVPGYAGGHDPAPTYEKVCSGITGHTEAVQITFDPSRVSYAILLNVFWRQVDPADAGGQFADRGSQYRPAIFTHDAEQERIARDSVTRLEASERFGPRVAVTVESFTNFFPAEEYHHRYCETNPGHYQRYKAGSGRMGFIASAWGNVPDDFPARDTDAADAAKTTKATQATGTVCDLSGLPDDELRKRLSPEQYRIARQNGTERPFANAYWDNKRAGLYVDVVSGEPLFSSRDKFDSGTGWPSFTRPIQGARVVEKTDGSHGMLRTEVRSGKADSHLGHVFPDGPTPTGLRYCINSAALRFIPVEDLEKEGYGEYREIFEGKRQVN